MYAFLYDVEFAFFFLDRYLLNDDRDVYMNAYRYLGKMVIKFV